MSDIIHTSGAPEDNIILFELGSGRGFSTPELAAKSAQSLAQAMGTVHALANRSRELVERLPQRPAEFELEFGVKIDPQVGAMVSQDREGGHLRIKLVWREQA